MQSLKTCIYNYNRKRNMVQKINYETDYNETKLIKNYNALEVYAVVESLIKYFAIR